MRDITGPLKIRKIGLPLRRDTGGVDQILLVEFFDECSIATGELGGLEELFNQTFHGIGLIEIFLVRPARPGPVVADLKL